MSDLFTDMEEERIHREGIMLDSNVPNAIEVAGEEMHRCEIKSVIRKYFPDGNKAADYFAEVEKKRGAGPAKRLRDDCRKAWAAHREQVAKDSAVGK